MEFENRYYSDDTIMMEYIRKICCRTWTIIGTVFAVLLALMGIIFLVKFNFAKFIEMVFDVAIVLGLTYYGAPKMAIWQMNQKNNAINRGRKAEYVIQFKDKIYISEGAAAMQATYEKVRKIYYLKNSCVLMIDGRTGFVVSYKGFTKGNLEAFKTFIENKCPKAKKKNR